jgi:tetratricopeptide (TPR) repeat protein
MTYKEALAVSQTFPCPVCRQPVPTGVSACQNPNCQVDLRSLSIIDTLPEGLFLLAQEQIREGKAHRAVQILESVVVDQPENVKAWSALAEAYASSGNRDDALRCWTRIAKIDPEDVRAEEELAKEQARRAAAARRTRRRQLLVSVLPAAGLLVIFVIILAALPQSGIAPDEVPVIIQAPVIPTTTPLPDYAAAVEEAVQSDPTFQDFQMRVEQAGLTVRLSGELPNQALKDQLEELLHNLPGAILMDTSRLKVVTPALAPLVREKLTASPQLSDLQIEVEQIGMSIRLRGMVHGLEAKQIAEELAASVAGVELVDSHDLVVSLPSYEESVTAALQADARTVCFEISVRQEGSTVLLTGSVYSREAFEITETLARGIEGVRAVDTSQLMIIPPYGEYTVQTGDNLESVARKVYGSSEKRWLIYDANPEKFPLQPGSVLVIPPEDALHGSFPLIDCTGTPDH